MIIVFKYVSVFLIIIIYLCGTTLFFFFFFLSLSNWLSTLAFSSFVKFDYVPFVVCSHGSLLFCFPFLSSLSPFFFFVHLYLSIRILLFFLYINFNLSLTFFFPVGCKFLLYSSISLPLFSPFLYQLFSLSLSLSLSLSRYSSHLSVNLYFTFLFPKMV